MLHLPIISSTPGQTAALYEMAEDFEVGDLAGPGQPVDLRDYQAFQIRSPEFFDHPLELRGLLNDGPGDADQLVDPEDLQPVRSRDPGQVLSLPVNAGL